ncbi:bestrophin family protein [Taibaiella koreensis]|uniref:bestrophin family protein n=1 Tax=Taibaiella koreensis TaxID=1268548 RepID=UPI000E59C1BD|nr:bestrophin family protein [Taibaiella koreensis]
MKIYNPKDWYEVLFHIQKSDTLRRLFPYMVFVALFSLGIAFWEIEYLHLGQNSWVKNVPVMHTLLGFAISMLLVFRTNTAYDRWWEGRKLWGALVNNSRNLALKLNVMLDTEDKNARNFFRETIPLYASVLKDHLQSEVTRMALDETDHPELDSIDTRKHVPNQVAGLMMQRINTLYKQDKLSGDQLITLNGELSSFTDICGACERIKNTPIPYSYSSFIKKFIFIYVMTLPFGYVVLLGYYVAPIVTFVFYVLASLELVAEEIEDPFGFDPNDLPMDKMASNIKKHVGEII